MEIQEISPARLKNIAKKIVIEVPMPSSANHLWRVGRGVVHKSKAYQSWLKAAGWDLVAQRPSGLTGLVKVKVRAAIPDNARDIDNLVKPLLDLLQVHEVVTNDRSVMGLDATWDRLVPPGRVRIEVSRTNDPRGRLTARGRKAASENIRVAHRRYTAGLAAA